MRDEDKTKEQLLEELRALRSQQERLGNHSELMRQKEILQSIFDRVPVMIRLMAPNGRLQLVNRHWEKVMGWSPEEALNVDVSAECYPDLHCRQQVLDDGGTPRPGWYEFKTRVRDGRTLDVSWANVLLSDGTSIRFGQDVTELKQALEKLLRSERRFAEVQRVARIGSWERDLSTNQVTWSDELYSLFGLERKEGELPYEKFLTLLVPEDADRARQVVEQSLREGRSFACDYRITTPDGALRIVHDRGEIICDEAGKPLRLVGTAQDVTERRRAEERLREFADSLQTLSRRLVEVQEEERRRVARELHDEIGQVLTSLKFALEASASAPPGAAGPKLGEARALI
jgi:PAS domain S-box-containing protein